MFCSILQRSGLMNNPASRFARSSLQRSCGHASVDAPKPRSQMCPRAEPFMHPAGWEPPQMKATLSGFSAGQETTVSSVHVIVYTADTACFAGHCDDGHSPWVIPGLTSTRPSVKFMRGCSMEYRHASSASPTVHCCSSMACSSCSRVTGPMMVCTSSPCGSTMNVVGSARGAPSACGGSKTSAMAIG